MGINLITDDLVNANAKAQFYNTTPATADGSLRVLFDTTEFNDNDIFVLDTVNREVVCNFNGVVQVNVDLSASSGTLVSARISLNNSAEYATGIINSGGSRATSSAMVAVSSGDRISVKDSGGATYGGAIWDMKLDIARVADYSAGSAAGFGVATPEVFGLLKTQPLEKIRLLNDTASYSGAGSSDPIQFDTQDGIAVGSWTHTAGSITIPTTGWYQFNTFWAYNTSIAGNRTCHYSIDGGSDTVFMISALTHSSARLWGSFVRYITAGQVVTFYQDAGVAFQLFTGGSTWLDISRIPDVGITS